MAVQVSGVCVASSAMGRPRASAGALDLSKQHYSEKWAINPFKRVVAVRKVMFADGSTETLARFIDVPDRVTVGGMRIPLPDESRAERCRKVAEARATRELRWALQSIGADHLLTCTFKGNLQDHRKARKIWSYFVKLVNARYPQWRYAVVMELQERGAIHFHAGVKGFQDVRYLRTAWLRAAGDYGGNIDVAADQRRYGGSGHTWRPSKLAAYMGKYLSKAFGWMPKHSQRFTASDDRVRPVIDRWWIEYAIDDVAVIRSIYRLTAGTRAIGVRQWLSPDGGAYMVTCQGPKVDTEICPF